MKNLHRRVIDFCNAVKGTQYRPSSVQGVLIDDDEIIIQFKYGRVIVTSEKLNTFHFVKYFGDRHSITV